MAGKDVDHAAGDKLMRRAVGKKRGVADMVDQRIAVPETPMHLDALLSDEVLVGGLAPQLGPKHLRTLSVTGFPAVTVPGMLDELNRLGFAYRWTTRAICLDKVSAQRMLGRIRRLWFSKRKSLAAIIKEVLTNEASVLVDTDAANKSAEADAALQDLGADIAGYAYVTTTITVLSVRSSRRSPASIAGSGSTIARSRSSPRQRRSGIITASPRSATGCSISG